jgi:hypothetical protein
MLEGRRNAYGNVVRKPLGKQSVINPRKVELTVGCEKESWIPLAQEDVHFRSLAYHPSPFQLLYVSISLYYQKMFACE